MKVVPPALHTMTRGKQDKYEREDLFLSVCLGHGLAAGNFKAMLRNEGFFFVYFFPPPHLFLKINSNKMKIFTCLVRFFLEKLLNN